MTGAERGFLLLCGDLGDGLQPLTPAQLRSLRRQIRLSDPDRSQPDRPLQEQDLRQVGCSPQAAERILTLLNREQTLDAYLAAAELHGITPLTLISRDYPARLRSRLGEDAPAVLFCRGNRRLLKQEAVGLTGSRQLTPEGEIFARRIGSLAAAEGRVLVSGNARGADQLAQSACLEAGGSILAFVPGELQLCEPGTDRELFVCETGWHLPFASFRALRRNRLIYALAEMTYISQSGLSGGTFSGASEALRRDCGPLLIRADGGPGARELIRQGAVPTELPSRLSRPEPPQLPLTPRPED